MGHGVESEKDAEDEETVDVDRSSSSTSRGGCSITSEESSGHYCWK